VVEASAIAPDFSAAMTGGGTFSLSSHNNTKLVLYFYPKDNTPGCTTESMHFRDLHPEFLANNCRIFGISRDSIRSHENFKAKLGLPFELISDPDETICNLYRVMKMKKLYGRESRGIERSTFVIDTHGKIIKEWRGLKVSNHVEAVLTFIKTCP
jgi:thioredoxin-dependent peroxiredoxin